LQERKFKWEKGEAFIAEKQAKDKELDADKENKRLQLEKEELWRILRSNGTCQDHGVLRGSQNLPRCSGRQRQVPC
jgi:hypothetical protein